MHKASRRPKAKIKENAIDSLQKMLDKIGVPHDMKWRSAILFMRSIKDYSIYTDDQKRRVQALLLDVLKGKRFTESDFYSVERKLFDVMSESSKLALEEELREISRLIGNTKSMLLQQKGDMQALEASTIDLLQSESSIDHVIRHIRLGFQEMITLVEENTTKLIEQSLTDPLTGLGNRRALDVLMAALDDRASRGESQALSILMLDADNFKMINDTYGHSIGDQALASLAEVLRRLCQRFPGPCPMVTPFRYGGEEFTVVVHGLDPGQAQDLAEELRSTIERLSFEIRVGDGNIASSGIQITVSIGVASRQASLEKASGGQLLTIADECLYSAKTQGRNQIICALSSF